MKYEFGTVASNVSVRQTSDTATTEKLNSFIEAARALTAVVKGDSENDAAPKSADSSRDAVDPSAVSNTGTPPTRA